jgi:phage tail-like protein
MAWEVFRCWPSTFTALAELDANAATVAIESLVLENEGWARDVNVTEPVEPSTG